MYRTNLKNFLAQKGITATTENVENTTYTQRKKIGVDWVLCSNLDAPELWVPSSGTKSYQLLIDGEAYEFQKVLRGMSIDNINSEADLSGEVKPLETAEEVFPGEMVFEVDPPMVAMAKLDGVALLSGIQEVLHQHQVMPNKILRAMRTLESLIEKDQSALVIQERIKSALHFEGVDTPVIDKAVELVADNETPEVPAQGTGVAKPVEVPELMEFVEKVTALKSDLEKLQIRVSQNPEKLKALDDALSACDLISHHLLDIAEDDSHQQETV